MDSHSKGVLMEIRTNKDGTKRYRETVTIANRRAKSPFFKKKTDAKNWKAGEMAKREKAKLFGAEYFETPKIKLLNYSNDWLESRIRDQRSISTFTEYKRMITTKIVPIVSDKYLDQINQDDGYKLIRELQKLGHNPRGVNKILALFKQIIKEAEKDELLQKNPLKNVVNLKEIKRVPTYWSSQEINSFLVAVKGHYAYEFYFTALNTGMRRGELAGLLWDKVDFQRSMIEISRIRDRYGLRDTTKSGKTRFVPMNSQLKETLLRLFQRRQNEYVFIRPDGDPVSSHHAYRNFNSLQKKTGVSKIRIHDLRHTFASHFMMNGGNLYDLQKILGHYNFSMTQIYAHLSPDHLSKTTEILNFEVVETNKCPEVTPDGISPLPSLASENSGKVLTL